MLFGIVFMWQMPHFLAIAWMYRDEYARAGMPLLPVIEPDGRTTGRQTVLYTAVLDPVQSACPPASASPRAWYLVGAITLGAILMVLSLEFSAKRTVDAAGACSSDRSSTCRSSGRSWCSTTALDSHSE